MFSLDMLDCPMYSLSSSTWNFLCWMSWGDHSKSVLLFGFLCGTLPSCSKVVGWSVQAAMWWCASGYVVVAYRNLVSAQALSQLSLSHWAWVTEPEFEPDWAWVPEPSLSLTINVPYFLHHDHIDYKQTLISCWRSCFGSGYLCEGLLK